jgi:hypothetical protein
MQFKLKKADANKSFVCVSKPQNPQIWGRVWEAGGRWEARAPTGVGDDDHEEEDIAQQDEAMEGWDEKEEKRCCACDGDGALAGRAVRRHVGGGRGGGKHEVENYGCVDGGSWGGRVPGYVVDDSDRPADGDDVSREGVDGGFRESGVGELFRRAGAGRGGVGWGAGRKMTAEEEEEEETMTVTDRSGTKKVARCWWGKVAVLIYTLFSIGFCNKHREKGGFFCHGS